MADNFLSERKFTEDEIAELSRLLGKVAANGYVWPTEESMRAAHAVVSFWASEIVIVNEADKKILLARYGGGAEKFKDMWHIPGGYNRWDETIEETCSRVAKREIEVDVRFSGVIDAEKWKKGEHPYGWPLSVYVRCEPLAPIQESDQLRFFRFDNLPEGMIAPHRRFIEKLRLAS